MYIISSAYFHVLYVNVLYTVVFNDCPIFHLVDSHSFCKLISPSHIPVSKH